MGSIDSDHVKSSKELLESDQSHLWNHTFSFINSMSLKCAIELGIPDTLHKMGKPMSLSDLSASLSIPPMKTPFLGRLMCLLVHSKFFASHNRFGDSGQNEEVYSLTTFSEILISDKSTGLSPFVLLMLGQWFLLPWHSLSQWFKGEEPSSTAFEIAHGMPVWEATGKMDELNRMLNEGMSSDASFTTEVIVRDNNCRDAFRGLRSLVDVGGGTGTLARAIVKAFPEVSCTVLDLPHVVEGLEGSGEVQFVAGDMFDNVPPADATLLKWVLHDWSDEECVKILKKCKDAIPVKEAGGKVIIIDMVIDSVCEPGHDSASHQTQLLFDVHMMVHTTGKQRSEQEWRKIFADAGFRGCKILPILGLRSVIEVYR